MSAAENRNIKIDELKGMTALLVVVGHIIQYIICSGQGYWENRVFCFIYSFHMPLFMFISGYSSYRAKGHSVQWLWKRVVNLFVPFVIWSLFLNICIRGRSVTAIGEVLAEIFRTPDKGYWFFLVLLENCIILFLMEKAFLLLGIKKCWIKLLIAMAVVCMFRFGLPFINNFGIGLLKWHMFFYLAGYFVRNCSLESSRFNKLLASKKIHMTVIVLFPFFTLTWNNELTLVMLRGEGNRFFAMLMKFVMLTYQYLVPIIGIAGSCILIWYLKESFVTRFLQCLGRYTMELYILQVIIIRPYTGNVYLDMLICFMTSVAGGIVVSKWLEKIPVLHAILFGKIRRPYLCRTTTKK